MMAATLGEADGGGDRLAFAGFQFCLKRKRLVRGDGAEVRLGARARDLLSTLLHEPGRVVPASELIAAVWIDESVDGSNLRMQMKVLRQALEERPADPARHFIQNTPGRGYAFVAPVSRLSAPKAQAAGSARPPRASPRLVGRDVELMALKEAMEKHRLLCVTGPGGVGKTALVAEALPGVEGGWGDDLLFVDLAPLRYPDEAASAVAAALDLEVPVGDAAAALTAVLKDAERLLVLDNCEHMRASVAQLSQRLLYAAPGLRILATSREPLAAAGERVFRLEPLSVDDQQGGPAGAAAVELFLQHAAAAAPHVALEAKDAGAIAELCRRLDGLPLAIDFAAAQLGAFGLHGLLSNLSDRFGVLSTGRRTARARHRTLRATLDWSHDTLSPMAQRVLRRLSIFRGSAPREAVIEVTADSHCGRYDVEAAIDELVAKSLLVSREHERDVRLLETTRAYAAEKLAESGEACAVAALHARWILSVVAQGRAAWPVSVPAHWRQRFSPCLEDVRAALDWALGPEGEPAIGVELTLASWPLWFALSRLHEYRWRAEAALVLAEGLRPRSLQTEMGLNVVLSSIVFNSEGAGPAMAGASARALAVAEGLGDTEHQMRALWGLSGERFIAGDYEGAVALAERFGQVAEAAHDESARLVYARMMALGMWTVGDHASALRFAEQAMRHAGADVRSVHKEFNEYDSRVATATHLTKILWVTGQTAEAQATARDGLERALRLGYPPTVCYILAFAVCPLALWSGDTAWALESVSLLETHSANRSFRYWSSWARCHAAGLSALRGEPVDLTALSASALEPLHRDLLATVDIRLAFPEALARGESGAAPWSQAEALRAAGELALERAGPRAEVFARERFLQAFAIARRQGAGAWALRAALSAARLCADRPNFDRLRSALANVSAASTRDRAAAFTLLGR